MISIMFIINFVTFFNQCSRFFSSEIWLYSLTIKTKSLKLELRWSNSLYFNLVHKYSAFILLNLLYFKLVHKYFAFRLLNSLYFKLVHKCFAVRLLNSLYFKLVHKHFAFRLLNSLNSSYYQRQCCVVVMFSSYIVYIIISHIEIKDVFELQFHLNIC